MQLNIHSPNDRAPLREIRIKPSEIIHYVNQQDHEKWSFIDLPLETYIELVYQNGRIEEYQSFHAPFPIDADLLQIEQSLQGTSDPKCNTPYDSNSTKHFTIDDNVYQLVSISWDMGIVAEYGINYKKGE